MSSLCRSVDWAHISSVALEIHKRAHRDWEAEIVSTWTTPQVYLF